MKFQLVLLAALPAFGQGLVGMSGSFGTGPDGSIRGTATFHVSSFLPPAILNAPYSGEEVIESVQVLADGTRITRQHMGPQQKIWRDSQGRVRAERQIGAPGPRADSNNKLPAIVEISDPVAGYVYVVDSVNRVTHRVRVEARPGGAMPTSARALAAPPPPAAIGMTAAMTLPAPGMAGGGTGGGSRGPVGAPGGEIAQRPQSTVEQLGTKMIDGVLTTGTRWTTVIPEGVQGNDRPMTTTSETWMSNQLQLALLSVSSSPLGGTTTRKFVDFSTAEPDATLFMPPAGYTMVDEKDGFTIRWGEQ